MPKKLITLHRAHCQREVASFYYITISTCLIDRIGDRFYLINTLKIEIKMYTTDRTKLCVPAQVPFGNDVTKYTFLHVQCLLYTATIYALHISVHGKNDIHRTFIFLTASTYGHF